MPCALASSAAHRQTGEERAREGGERGEAAAITCDRKQQRAHTVRGELLRQGGGEKPTFIQLIFVCLFSCRLKRLSLFYQCALLFSRLIQCVLLLSVLLLLWWWCVYARVCMCVCMSADAECCLAVCVRRRRRTRLRSLRQR